MLKDTGRRPGTLASRVKLPVAWLAVFQLNPREARPVASVGTMVRSPPLIVDAPEVTRYVTG